MNILEINFNCLCIFVPDHEEKVVHVLMPATHAASPHGDDDIPHHVVRLVHPRLRRKGVSMEGWELVLDKRASTGGGTADTRLRPEMPARSRERITNLSAITRRRIPRRLIEEGSPKELVSRVVLRAGRLKQLRAEASWTLNRRRVVMAYKVVWRIEDFPARAPLRWNRMSASGDKFPLESLKDLGYDADGVFRLGVYHVTPDALPPQPDGEGSVLEPEHVKSHFRALYRPLGITRPPRHHLPEDPKLIYDPGLVFKYDCPTAQGAFKDG